jgi:hypothetical protein
MSNAEEKISQIKLVLMHFDDALRSRPELLGSPEEVNAIFFYLDKIRFILADKKDFEEFDKSWIGFLIKKKLIVGANDHLVEGLKSGVIGFAQLRELREEYFAWRDSF